MLDIEIGIDLGTSSVLIYLKGKGIVLKEPSVVAIDTIKNKVIAIGKNAKKMFEKAPPHISVIRPLKDGTISDYTITEIMLKYFIAKVISRNSIKKPKVVVCIPCQITNVEKKAVQDSIKDAGAREVFIIEEPIAAAIGLGLDISKPFGYMIVDIGAGTTDVAVISLGKIVVGLSTKFGGDKFDEDIITYIRKKYNVIIGNKTAENIKKEIGFACKIPNPYQINIKGQSLVTSLPTNLTIDSNEIYDAIEECIKGIIKDICNVFEKTPPELSSDIFENGIIMTGGGSLLNMLPEVIQNKTGIRTFLSKDVFNPVVLGTGKYIKYTNSFLNKLNKNLKYLWR